jgi:predicted GNAT family acetyltransferase
MRFEELGDDPLQSNPAGFRLRVLDRIQAGASWLVRDADGIAFKVDVGTHCSLGAQLEGVYTRPDRRGQGLASRSLRALCRSLLGSVPRVTLHVWERNAAAVACYRGIGFVDHAPYRVVLR